MFKILTKNGIENTNIDGARANRLLSGGKSGVVSDAFNENTLLILSNNRITVNTCELIISGHRIVLTEPESVTVSNTPTSVQQLSLIAQLDVSASSVPSFSLILQKSSTPLTQDNLFTTAQGSGRYQMELAQVTHQVSGALTNLVRTVKSLQGGGGSGDVIVEGGEYITIGEVTVSTIGDTPSVNIENTVGDDGKLKTDFHFTFPEGNASAGSKVYNHYMKVYCRDDNGYGYVQAYINFVSARENAYTGTDLPMGILNKDIIATGWASYELWTGTVMHIRFVGGGVYTEYSYYDSSSNYFFYTDATFFGDVQIEDTVIEGI